MNKKQILVVGYTQDPHKFLELGEKAREEGFNGIDCIMPYPVHGFEEAYGFKWSWVGLAAFIALLSGWGLGFLMQTWMMGIDYPINIGGKPHFPWPSFIPVTFECGILAAALTTLVSLIISGKLCPHPCLKVIREKCTDDLFSIIIPVNGEEGKSKAESFLKQQNAEDVESFPPAILTRTQCEMCEEASS